MIFMRVDSAARYPGARVYSLLPGIYWLTLSVTFCPAQSFLGNVFTFIHIYNLVPAFGFPDNRYRELLENEIGPQY